MINYSDIIQGKQLTYPFHTKHNSMFIAVYHSSINIYTFSYPGGLKEIAAWRLHEKDPTQVLRKAVYGMLPKNNLRKKRMRRLHLFPGSVSVFIYSTTLSIQSTIF